MPFSQCRIDALEGAIAKLGAEAMYVRDTLNIQWLTGFQGVFDEERAHAMMVFANGSCPLLHTDSRYITAMQRESEETPIEVDADLVAFAQWAYSKTPLKTCASLAIEDSIALAEYRALEKAFEGGKAEFIETENLVLRLRAVKGHDEIALMRAAQGVTDSAFDHICGFIRPGMTERQIQLELDNFMLANGADELAFPSIVASGPNGASPHAIVSDKPVEAGECIVMDFGARKDGYCSDMTRVVFLGEPDAEMANAWEVLRRANETVENALGPGMTGEEAHELAENVLADGGFAGCMGHGLGHGVGMQVHELPNLNTRNDKPLQEGNVVTVEPGIYIPGRFGMRLEDYGVIAERGFEVFTRSAHEMVVL